MTDQHISSAVVAVRLPLRTADQLRQLAAAHDLAVGTVVATAVDKLLEAVGVTEVEQ